MKLLPEKMITRARTKRHSLPKESRGRGNNGEQEARDMITSQSVTGCSKYC